MEQSKRIQTSLLNGVEKKALVWMAERMPHWVTSDMLSFIGFLGALVIAAGYLLSSVNINWLWLSSAGFVIHWFGDSLDGTLARVRHCQRPLYGFYLDHTLDVITEFIMFAGIGLSGLVRFDLSMLVFIAYLFMTLNVMINSHLKGEFRLTYIKLGPTEFRLLMIIINTLLMYVAPMRAYMNWIAIALFAIIMLIYLVTVCQDLRDYARRDPLPKTNADSPETASRR